MSAVSAVASNGFTDEMLAKNFTAIASGFQDFDKLIGHLEGHVGELSSTVQTLVAKAPRGSKFKPFVLGAVAGVVVYKYVTRNRTKLENIVSDVQTDVRERVSTVMENTKNGPGKPA